MPLDLAVSMVSVDDVLLELGQTDADHLRIERLINEASHRIEAFCDRPFKARDVVVTLDGNGDNMLSLGGPVQRVAALTFLSQSAGVANTDVLAADYIVNPRRGIIYYSGGFPSGFQNVQIVCRIGEDPINPAIKGACLDLVRHLYRQPDASDLFSEKIGDYSYTRYPRIREDKDPDIPEDVQAKLLPYKRWSFL
jgi:hypothetical protein